MVNLDQIKITRRDTEVLKLLGVQQPGNRRGVTHQPTNC